MIVGIDPGPSEHAIVRLESGIVRIVAEKDIVPGDLVAFEQFAPYARSLDDGSLRTVFETGRLIERLSRLPVRIVGIRRQQVKRHLLGVVTAGDPQVRAALIERYGPTKELAVGTKKAPGPLYGISSHHWAALAVAVTASDQLQIEEARRLSWTTLAGR